jgi:sec-independent protein translocase protein TatA
MAFGPLGRGQSYRKIHAKSSILCYFLAMFGLSGGHLLIVAVVVLLFGSRRLPELGSALGKGIGAFKKGLEGSSQDSDQNNRLT